MTYPEYARRGAYPLVATALLAAVFVLLAFPSGERSGASAWSRRLVYLWIGQNILLTASAIWRLGMYIDAFGLTRLRVAAAIWMMLVVAGLISIIWRIVGERSNAWLLRVNTLTLLTVLFGCCFVNFDRLIAWQGVRNCYELRGDGSPRLDLEYLGRLGIDAIPALEWFAAELGNEHPKAVEAIQLAASRREQMERNMSCWQGWTLRQQRLVAGSGVR